MDKLPAIQGLWVGNRLGPLQQLSLKSFMAYGHPYHLYTYEKIENVPEGVEIKDGNEILAAKYLFKGLTRGYAPFSDWFRWTLMQKKGGIYMDLDTLALRPLDFKGPTILCFEDPGRKIAPGVLRIPSDHPLVQMIINRCKNPRNIFIKKLIFMRAVKINHFIKHSKKNIIIRLYEIFKILFLTPLHILLSYVPGISQYGSKVYQRSFCDGDLAGPNALVFEGSYTMYGKYTILNKLKKHVREELKQVVLPKIKFYPVSYVSVQSLSKDYYADKDLETIFPESYTVHMWQSILKNKDLTNDKISSDSIFYKAAQKYNVSLND